MSFNRPDLSKTDPVVREYIEYLENQLNLVNSIEKVRSPVEQELSSEYSEPPTRIQLLTATSTGFGKRTPRHHYTRQRRGGMGIFDIDISEPEQPSILVFVDESQTLLALTDQARAFRLTIDAIPLTEVRARPQVFTQKMDLHSGEKITALLPVKAEGYLTLLSSRGMVRSLRHHIFGDYMKPGISLYDPKSFGPLAAASWTPGNADVFIATRKGKAIRFSEKLIPPQGCQGIRVAEDDSAVTLTHVYPDSVVFILAADGKGTSRSMVQFKPNKSPGAGGKNAMLTEELVGAANVDSAQDVFIISALSKLIRFQLAEVPVKEGLVQGVNCMNFRNDHAVALTVSHQENAL